VPRSTVRQRIPHPVMDEKPFWLFSLMQTLVTALIAYVVALFIELVLLRVASLPHGPLWVQDFYLPFLFIITGVVVGIMSIPYWMKEWDPGLRSFSMFSSAFLAAMTVFTQTGFFNPDLPLRFLTNHVFLPLRHILNI
jgi:hypothetical protein